MAEEVVTILKYDTAQSIKSVKDLRDAMQLCRDQLVAMDQSMGDAAKESQAYSDTVDRLQGYQRTLNEVMAATKSHAEAVKGSYYDLNAQLVEARKAWKNMTEEQRIADAKMGEDGVLGKIQALDRQLKNMDASIGQYQRNVGDYAGQVAKISGLFGNAGKSASGAISSVMGFTSSLKAMSATPVIAILGVLATVLQKVIDSLKTSEDTTNALTMAFAPLKSAGDLVTKVFQSLGGALATAVEWLTKMADKLGLVSDAMRERQEIAAKEIELSKRERDTLTQNADLRREIAELNAKSMDKEHYTAKERVAFLEEAAAKEKEIAQRAYDDAKLAYEVQKAKNDLTESSAEEKKAEAQAYATMVAAETDYFNKTKELTGRISELRQQAVTEDAAAATAKLTAEKTLIEQELALAKKGSSERLKLQKEARAKQYATDVASKKSTIKDRETLNKTLKLLEEAYNRDIAQMDEQHARDIVALEEQQLENRMNAYEQGQVEYLALAVELKQHQVDTLRQLDDESDAEFEGRQLEAVKALAQAKQSLTDATIAEARQELENTMNALADGSVEQLSAAVDLARYDLDNLYQQIGESDAEFQARRLETERTYQASLEALYQGEVDLEHQRRENRMNELVAGSEEYLAAAIELKQYELDTLHQMESESNEDFRARQLAAEKEYTGAKQSLLEKQVSDLSSYASNASNIFSSVADILESSTEDDEEATKAAKNLRIAGAIIDTLSGAATAYATAQKLGPPQGIIVGAANAATVIAAGMAQVAKIRATTVSTTSAASTSAASSGASVSSPTPASTIATTSILTGKSDEERLNKMAGDQKVYILSSDLEANGKRVQMQYNESSF